MLIEQYLPTYDVQDYHEAPVRAPAETAYAVLRALDLNRSWIMQALFTLRSLPSRLLRRPPPPLPSRSFLAAGTGHRFGHSRRGPGPRVGGLAR